jgi:APA family basic amino acid/polyamine antiporter
MLKRAITRWDLFFLMINSIIGAGIFGLPAIIYNEAGVFSIPAIMICAVLIFIIILNFSEVASIFKQTGGPYLYTSEAFGKFPGFLLGWLALVSRIATFAALINLMADYLTYLDTMFSNYIVRIITIILFTTFLFLINYQGVKHSSRLNNFMAIAKLIPLIIFVIVGFFFIDFNLLHFKQDVPSFDNFSSVIFVLVFAFTGFESTVINAGEMKNPGKDIPFALVSATVFVAFFYTFIQVVCIGTYPQLGDSTKPIADASHLLMGSAGGIMITIGAVISIGGTLNAILLAGSRLPFAFSEAGQFPKIFSKEHSKSGVPFISLIVFTIITVLVSVSGTFVYALSISVISKVMIFLIVSAALIKFRYSNKAFKPYFKLRYGIVSAVLGIIICICLLFSSDPSDFLDVLITMLIGFLIYMVFKFSNR